MKSIVKNFGLALSVLLLSQVAFANNELPIRVMAKNANSIMLDLQNLASPNTSIRILDQYNEEQYREELDVTSSNLRSYDVTQLENGTYTLEIEDAQQLILQPFELTTKKLILNETDQVVIYKPSLVQKGNSLDLTLLQLQKGTTSLMLIDIKGNILHRDTIVHSGSISKSYDLRNLNRGNYQVVITTPFKTFYNTISIR